MATKRTTSESDWLDGVTETLTALNEQLGRIERSLEERLAGGEAQAVALRRQRLEVVRGGKDDAEPR